LKEYVRRLKYKNLNIKEIGRRNDAYSFDKKLEDREQAHHSEKEKIQ
jgi:hypothetical protein